MAKRCWHFGDDPVHETVWPRGAAGEEHVARLLEKYLMQSGDAGARNLSGFGLLAYDA